MEKKKGWVEAVLSFLVAVWVGIGLYIGLLLGGLILWSLA